MLKEEGEDLLCMFTHAKPNGKVHSLLRLQQRTFTLDIEKSILTVRSAAF